ncbi:hypothetical protein JHK85_016720 [Glycine max]|nr:hypothetical protein JHK85_016720 [Glycine max]
MLATIAASTVSRDWWGSCIVVGMEGEGLTDCVSAYQPFGCDEVWGLDLDFGSDEGNEFGFKCPLKIHGSGDHEEDHDSMPQLPRILLLLHSHRAKHGVFFILDEASLVAAYVGKVSSFLGHSHPSVSCFYERNEVFLSLIIAWPISEIPDFESR